jgi:hypothetical protein
LAVALTTPSIRRGPRAASRKAFRYAGELPEQPLGVEVLAAVAQARAGSDRQFVWDARLETSLIAVHGYLWRRGRGEKWAGAAGSSRYACSLSQLVFGLAEIMGWRGIPDRHDDAGRRRFVKRHRKSVQRWLAWLQLAGLVDHTPQQDEEGFWWRTIIELQPVPQLPDDVLTAARARRSCWVSRECRRAARGRVRDLTAILRRARLTKAQRRARAVQRRRELRDCQARNRVRELLARSIADAASEHLTHPDGVSTTSQGLLQALTPPKTWSRGRTRTRTHVPHTTETSKRHSNSASTRRTEVGEERRWAVHHDVQAVRDSRSEEQWEVHTTAITRRADELSTWASQYPCPRWRLIEAWSLAVHGPYMTAAGAQRLALWREAAPKHGPRLDRALARYERAAPARPPGFPATAIAAFAYFLTHHTLPGTDGAMRGMAYDVARFNELSKGMSAYTHITQAENATRAQARARRRVARALTEQTNQRLNLRFRLSPDAQVKRASELLDSDDARHQATGRRLHAAQQRTADAQTRDQHVAAGRDPWPLDGRYRAADRYAKRWALPTPFWAATDV